MNATERSVLDALIVAVKGDRTHLTDAQAFGRLLSTYFHWDARILSAAAYALEDANFHGEAGQVQAMLDALVRASEDDPIDRDRRSALFAALNEVFPGISKDRTRRLAKLSLYAGHTITSLSDRYCDMTIGDFNRVMAILDDIRKDSE